MDKEVSLSERFINKSQEAFMMAIEIYNKPTIHYRVEGFAFFICNAWELLLKAKLINSSGESSIYYKNKPGRTLSLENCIKKVFTNDKDPLRINLEKIITLRNISTHYITEEYEQIYVPLFQSCVMNYCNKLLSFFDIDITEKIPANFLTLSVKLSPIESEEIQARYPQEIALRLLKSQQDVHDSMPETGKEKYAILVRHDIYLTKKPKEATVKVSLAKDASDAAFIMKEYKDMQLAFPYKRKDCIQKIQQWISRNKINFINPTKDPESKEYHAFNTYHFKLFTDFYDIKSNPKYCYIYRYNPTMPLYTYSDSLIQFIISEIKKDPEHIIQNLRSQSSTIKKSTPGAKEF